MSHFSFTRSSYDNCALDKKEQESTGPFRWITDKETSENSNKCFLSAASPFMQNPFRSIPQERIDAESDLRGQTLNLSKCPQFKFNPYTQKHYDIPAQNECSNMDLVPEYTRSNRSCNVLSGISINRFTPLCEDIQIPTKIHSNDYIGENTRLKVKDDFTMKKKYSTSGQPYRAPASPTQRFGWYN